MKTILVTGAAGYIGSHTCLELLVAGYKVVAIDNLCNSVKESLNRVAKLTNATHTNFRFHHCDIREEDEMNKLMFQHRPDAVIHFAGLKSVAESIERPMKYYDTNVGGTITLLKAMDKWGVNNLVFSSSATVYNAAFGGWDGLVETSQVGPVNPYGHTKLVVEDMLRDLADQDCAWSFPILRYFNPVGAHPSREIGESPLGEPANLVPYITGVMAGRFKWVNIYGDDYPTTDGTGVRDYIHVVDLARAHLRALEWSFNGNGARVFNIGTGTGTSVLQMVSEFSKLEPQKDIPCHIVGRRPGDVAICLANPSRANIELGWHAERSLTDMCRDAWNWQERNPRGYD